MKSPSDMKIIQIDITNACIHNCSNCTRMCGHHETPFFMDWETFKRAVDSLEGFEGCIGVMGGEPTLHPEFERFSRYLASKYSKKEDNYLIEPTSDFISTLKLEERNRTKTYQSKAGINTRVKGPGLWSSVSFNYHKHYELIQDIFSYQCVNDHMTPCYHQPVLIARKDLGIADDQWYELRAKCWVQNRWSASITPKGCFFCEIAGALDMLFDGPGGWPIEEDWWKISPENFGGQLEWCEICGMALDTFSRNANDEIDDLSDTLYKKMESLGVSSKLKKGQVRLYTGNNSEGDSIQETRKYEYHNNDFDRLSKENTNLYPKEFNGIVLCDSASTYDDIRKCIDTNIRHFSKVFVIADENILNLMERSNQNNVILLAASYGFGNCMNTINKKSGKDSYNIIINYNIVLDDCFSEKFIKYVFNPGTFHYSTGFVRNFSLISNINEDNNDGIFALYHTSASALRYAGWDRIALCKNIEDFKNLWEIIKIVELTDEMLEESKQEIFTQGMRYAIWGAGTYGKIAYEQIKEKQGKIVFYCDSDKEKWQDSYMGKQIISPEELLSRRDEYDMVVIASLAYNDISQVLLNVGLKEGDFIAPIF